MSITIVLSFSVACGYDVTGRYQISVHLKPQKLLLYSVGRATNALTRVFLQGALKPCMGLSA